MTANAGLRTNGVVVKSVYKPICAVMAHLATLDRWDMRGAHARGNGAIMTTRTGALHLRMIHSGR